MQIQRDVPAYHVGGGWLLGARTNLVDRFTPAIERIYLPPFQVSGGVLRAAFEGVMSVSEKPKIRGWKKKLAQVTRRASPTSAHADPTTIAIELRYNSPDNWSHALNIHLTLALFIRQQLQRHGHHDRVTAILPERIPSHIVKLYELFEFSTLATDGDVHGRICSFECEPPISLRSIMTPVVREALAASALERRLFGIPASLPRKVFLARKDQRCLTNEAQIEGLLKSHGYEKVYPETLSVLEQLQLLGLATHIVAVHGAGIAPLTYRPASAPTCKFVEILTAGHMTNFGRVIASQIDAEWLGIRGRLWPDVVNEAYQFGRPFTKHSLTDFFVDPDTVQMALDVFDGREEIA